MFSYTRVLVRSCSRTLLFSYTPVLVHSCSRTLLFSYTPVLVHSCSLTLLFSYTPVLVHYESLFNLIYQNFTRVHASFCLFMYLLPWSTLKRSIISFLHSLKSEILFYNVSTLRYLNTHCHCCLGLSCFNNIQ